MKLSQFLTQPRITESHTHVEAAEVIQELKGIQKELREILVKLTETSQLGHRIAAIPGVETSYFGDIKEAGQQLSEHVANLLNSVNQADLDSAESEEGHAGDTDLDVPAVIDLDPPKDEDFAEVKEE